MMYYFNYSLIFGKHFNNPLIYVFLEMLYELYENVVYFIEELEGRENENKIQLPMSMVKQLKSRPEEQKMVGHAVDIGLFNQLLMDDYYV